MNAPGSTRRTLPSRGSKFPQMLDCDTRAGSDRHSVRRQRVDHAPGGRDAVLSNASPPLTDVPLSRTTRSTGGDRRLDLQLFDGLRAVEPA